MALAACGGSAGTSRLIPSQSSARGSMNAPIFAVQIGKFTEFLLPLGSHVDGLTRGRYDTLYTVDTDEASVYRMQSADGVVTTLSHANGVQGLLGDPLAVSRAVWYLAAAQNPPFEAFMA